MVGVGTARDLLPAEAAKVPSRHQAMNSKHARPRMPVRVIHGARQVFTVRETAVTQ